MTKGEAQADRNSGETHRRATVCGAENHKQKAFEPTGYACVVECTDGELNLIA